jgi:hypothetical protein
MTMDRGAAALYAIFLFAACGSDEPSPQQTAGAEAVEPAPAEPPASSASADADGICRAATEASAIHGAERRALAFADGLSQLTLTRETAEGFRALDMVEPGERYAALQRVFEEQGVVGWQCPALADWWTAAP